MIILGKTVITGIGATLIMDIWSLLQKYLLKVPPLNYALVGRWILWLWGGDRLCMDGSSRRKQREALRGKT